MYFLIKKGERIEKRHLSDVTLTTGPKTTTTRAKLLSSVSTQTYFNLLLQHLLLKLCENKRRGLFSDKHCYLYLQQMITMEEWAPSGAQWMLLWEDKGVAHVQGLVQPLLGVQQPKPLPAWSLHGKFFACSELLRIKCILNQILLPSYPFLTKEEKILKCCCVCWKCCPSLQSRHHSVHSQSWRLLCLGPFEGDHINLLRVEGFWLL